MIHSARYTAPDLIEASIDGFTVWVPDDPRDEYRQMIAAWEAAGNVVLPYVAPEPVDEPTILFPADLWRRASDAEAEAIDAAMSAEPVRIARLFMTASTYRSDDPLWPLLTGAAVALFGPARAAELLAPSN